jgi:hypothetical protein
MQREAEYPIAFATSRGDLDTLSYNDAMETIDSPEFKTAMVKEANVRSFSIPTQFSSPAQAILWYCVGNPEFLFLKS